MKLIGNYMSPFVRRVAVSLNVLGLAYELEELFASKEPERVRPFNPLTRVPTLVLDDGEALVESYAILDELDQMVGAARALTPPSGPARRRVMKLTAVGIGSIDKGQWSVLEARYHAPDKVNLDFVASNDRQSAGGIAFLDAEAAKAGDGWLAGGERMSQADVTGTVAFSFLSRVRPELKLAEKAPHLAALAARCEALDAFKAATPAPA